ncbi:MAG: DUF1207 domain-containing protein [Candidatus Marinimicrobia bacterium]|nr:DUF1207 domain-containing protein [Candidatus Neomarinimicrobiota bacterium]MCF7840929.1 DUF1207 domain-containing protein [Candidatus Neomarinimicrobiota bacterium]
MRDTSDRIPPARLYYFVSLFFLLIGSIWGQNGSFNFFPEDSWFKPPLLDPASAQSSASLLRFQATDEPTPKVYSPVNLGFQKILIRRNLNAQNGWEAGVEFGIHTQFSIISTPTAPMGGLDNTDYLIAGIWHYKHGRTVERLQLFHQSSHLGDDYLIRNQIVEPNNRSQNYEQLSYLRAHTEKSSRWYYGLGVNISPNTVRERILVQGGMEIVQSMGGNIRAIQLVAGVNVKLYGEHDYYPNLKTGAGVRFSRDKRSRLTLLVEYYRGHLPYSTLAYQKVSWLGLGAYLQPRF